MNRNMMREPNIAAATPGGAGYRRDVDGLRAIAVLPVVLFHASIAGFAGGFIGVDVFFVISGYLITQVLERSAHQPLRAALADFYLRRCRRILPALVVMLACVTALSAILLLPADLERFGMFLALSSAYLGNLAAAIGGGYFDASGASLLHLWSIGIEEQFYLVYPWLFFWVLRGTASRATLGLLLLAAASCALCVWGSYTHAVVNFYAPVTRAWELLAGAALARSGWRGFAGARANEAAAWLGLGLLVLCFASFDSRMRHPGAVTVLPCAATLLLLATGASRVTTVARLLALRPLVFTGLISYSLYLWHAPLLSLARYWSIFAPTPAALALLLAAIYLVSAASWRWVERPLRSRAWMPANRRFLAWMLGTSGALSLLGAAFWASHGWPQRFSAEVRALAYTVRGLGPGYGRCMTFDDAAVAEGRLCHYPALNATRRVVVWGDSHSLALLPAYEVLARERHVEIFMAGHSSCRPLLGLQSPLDLQGRCASFNAAMIEAVEHLDPQVVVLNAFWIYPEFMQDSAARRSRAAQAEFARAVAATLAPLERAGRKVCVVLDAPSRPYPVPYALATAQRRGLAPDFLELSRAAGYAQQQPVDDVFHALAQDSRVRLVDPKDLFCDARQCALQAADGRPLYNDADHLSRTAALALVDGLARCVGAE
jgi:peptidoglycan/LPS O-acetylase OafA/YrhL